MRRDELEHMIRAAADVTGEKAFIVIGSQAILGQYPDAPAPLLMSMEADLYARYAPDKSDFIDGSLGRDSRFDQTFGYHADGVSPSTAKLPSGREDRLTRIRNPNTGGCGRLVHRSARHRDRQVLRRPREGPPLPRRSVEGGIPGPGHDRGAARRDRAR